MLYRLWKGKHQYQTSHKTIARYYGKRHWNTHCKHDVPIIPPSQSSENSIEEEAKRVWNFQFNVFVEVLSLWMIRSLVIVPSSGGSFPTLSLPLSPLIWWFFVLSYYILFCYGMLLSLRRLFFLMRDRNGMELNGRGGVEKMRGSERELC